MYNLAQVASVCAPTFGALFVRYNSYERVIIYRGGVSYHFKPTIEKVVLLIRRFVFFLLLG